MTSIVQSSSPQRADPFVGGGEMAELMRSVDWASTPLGPIETWPQSLRTAVSILNASGFPMYIAWGPEFVQFYNDAYRPILGSTKHPAAMGQSTKVCFAEIWDFIGPMFERVLREGEQTYLEDQLLELDRHGFVEECYFTFSYSAIRAETGEVGGVFVTVIETTGRVLGERRLHTLRALAEAGSGATSAGEAATRQAALLGGEPRDLPFSLVYLLEDDGETLTLAGSSGIEAGSGLAPGTVRPDEAGELPWQLDRVLSERATVELDGLEGYDLPRAAWPEPVERAMALPISRPGQDRPAGVLVAGLSPRLAPTDDYRAFLQLVAGHVATAVADSRAYEEERQRAEALAALDRAKTAFFSDISHEFRTPLTLLLGPLEEALEDGRTVDPAIREELVVARRNALRLMKLVNTLLDFSRIEAGRVEAIVEPTDLAALTADLASVFRSAAERAGLHLEVSCPPLAGLVDVDREMWEKVVLNLLSNALKFTFDGTIRVALRDAGDEVELSVADTGTGIPTDEIERIFDRFHRVRGARARTHEGTGIGLSLVRELIRLHHGVIEVTSQANEGTTFTVRIPRRGSFEEGVPTDRPRSSTGVAAAAYAEEALRWLPDVDATGSDPAAEAPADRSGGEGGLQDRIDELTRGARILLADDNADMREYVTRLLSPRWTVRAVADGSVALAEALADPPDLVLSDVMMPGLDGFELLAALRAEDRTRDVPVVLLSARAGEESRIEGLGAGADDYLTKPFSGRELVARVAAHLQLAAHRRETASRDHARAVQSGRLAAATVAINAAATIEEMLEAVTREVRLTIGAHQAVTSLTVDGSLAQSIRTVSLSERYADWKDYAVSPDGSGIYAVVCESNQPMRLTQAELEAHPRWHGFGDQAASHPPMRGWLAAPLVARDGRNLGVVQLSDRLEGEFDEEDESLLVQMARIASIAIDRIQTDRIRVERERQQAAAAWLGQRALTGMATEELLDEACQVVHDALELDLVKVLELNPDGVSLRLAAGLGWSEGLVKVASVPAERASQAGYTLWSATPVIVEDLATEERFSGPALLTDHGVVSGMSVIIPGQDGPFGVLGAHTRSRRTFTANDVDFLLTIANIIAAALARHATEGRLAALALTEQTRASELRAVIEAMDEGIVVVDADGEVLIRNAAAETLLRGPLGSLADVMAGFIWERDDRPLEDAQLESLERRLTGQDERWGDLRIYPVAGKSASRAGRLGSIIVVREVTEERSQRTLRDAFIGVLSHELRTPITTIYAGSKLLTRPRRPDDGSLEGPSAAAAEHDRDSILLDIAAEADRLYRLVEDLLVLARFERGATQFPGEPVLLQRTLPASLRAEAARWPENHFEVDIAPNLPAVTADPTYAEQIARNLLANAAKYGESGTTVRVSAEQIDDEVIVRVCDEGPGIKAEEADRLFELFYRSPSTIQKPGAGIGLFVARRLAESMGGRIWARPLSPRGSEFGFALRVHEDV